VVRETRDSTAAGRVNAGLGDCHTARANPARATTHERLAEPAAAAARRTRALRPHAKLAPVAAVCPSVSASDACARQRGDWTG
jgi:hypothetical protein